MKTLKYLLLSTLATFCIQAHSQSVQWAGESENPAKLSVYDIAGYTDKSVFLVKSPPLFYNTGLGIGFQGQPKFFVDRYDLPDMHKVWTKEIWGTEDGTDKGKSLRLNGVHCLSTGLLAIALSHDYSIVYALQVSDDGVLLDSRKVTIGDMHAPNQTQRAEAPFKFAISKDRNTLLGFYVSRNSPIIHTVAIDGNLNIKWKKDITPSFSNNDFDIIEVCSVDGDEIGLLTRIKDKGSDQKYRYVTVYYNHSKDTKFETRMDLGGEKLIDGINFDMDGAGNPIAAGMYKNDGEKGLFGTFGFRIDAATGKVLSTASTEFTKDFITNFISARKADKGKGIPSLTVDEIYMTKDNDIVIASERFEIVEHREMGAGGMGGMSYTTYNYQDVVLAKLDGKTCQTQWVSILPKKQVTTNGLKESYGISLQDNAIYVAFCDNKKNADMDPRVFKEDADKLKTANLDENGKDLDLTLCTVDIGSGDVERKYLTRYKDDDSKLVFNALTLLSLQNTLFVYRGDRKNDQAGVLSLH